MPSPSRADMESAPLVKKQRHHNLRMILKSIDKVGKM